jgi:hypothetical protein
VESYPGPPTTLGNEGTSRVLLTMWCQECDHKMGPTAGMVARWDDKTPAPDRRERLAFPRCGSRRADNRRDRNRPAATRVVARLIVVGGLVLALSACSATRAIDIICPPTGQCPNTLPGHGGGYLSGRGRECDPRGAINSARLGAGRRVVDDIWRLIWLGYRDRSRRILVRRESGRGRVAAALER